MKYFLTFTLIFSWLCTPTLAEPADPKAYLQKIYENKGGYLISSDEASAILKDGGHPQYGEIPYDSAALLLADLNLCARDVFYDFGSGTGKLVLQVYLTTPVKRSIGIELSLSRWKIAEANRKQLASDDHLAPGREVGFMNQNILSANFSDATVCFINGITFPSSLIQTLMKRLTWLDHDIRVLSVLALPPDKHFTLLKTYELPMSWAPEGVEVFLYKVTPIAQTETPNKPKKRKKRHLHKNS